MIMVSADDVIREARDWVGAPFRHQGRSKETGADCAGVVIGVGRALGLLDHLVDYHGYGRTPHAGKMEQYLALNFDRIAEPRPGCILFMTFDREPQHVGIFTGDTLIHSFALVGRCVEHRLGPIWRERIVDQFSYRGAD